MSAVMSDTWLRSIEAAFEQQFGIQGVRAESSQRIPLQTTLKVIVPNEPTPEMEALGRAIEAEYAELDRTLWVQVVRSQEEV